MGIEMYRKRNIEKTPGCSQKKNKQRQRIYSTVELTD